MTTRIAILISGNGSNMKSLVEAISQGHDYSARAKVTRVISNNPKAAGLDFARSHDIETRIVNHRDYDSREAFDEALAESLDDIELVLLAGFMRVLGTSFVARFSGRLLNIHPSLLPDYPGLQTHARAIAAGERYAGASVHFVTAELDGGPVILQARVKIDPDDTVETLAARVLSKEHVIYPLALRYLLDGSISLDTDSNGLAVCRYQGVALDTPLLLE